MCRLAIISLFIIFSGCAGSGIGVQGSTAWYATASKDAIKQYEAENPGKTDPKTNLGDNGIVGLLLRTKPNDPSRGSIGTYVANSNYSLDNDSTFSSTSSRISTSGNTIYHSDGTSSRISTSGNTIYHSDGTSSRISASGNTIYHSDGTSSRISTSGNTIYHSDGTSSRISASGNTIYNSDGSMCRISSSGRQVYCN